MAASPTTSKSEIEQLADSFGLTTGRFLDDCLGKIELAKAGSDREALIKEQIKAEILRQTRNIFAHNYKRIVGVEPWSNTSHG